MATPTTAIGIDFGGTSIKSAVVRGGAIVQRGTLIDPQAFASSADLIDELVRLIESLRAEHSDVAGVGIGLPGFVDSAHGIVHELTNVAGWDEVPLCQILHERTGLAAAIENDVNAMTYAEWKHGAARGGKHTLCITLGTGVGSGIILDGKLWRGTDGSAAEIGHTTVDPFGGPQCKCGNFGCLEMYASATAMVRMTRESLERFPGSSLHGQCLSAKTIYDAGKAGDELAIEVFRNVGDYLGVALSNLINLLGPEVIVIGGGAANGWCLFEESMRKQIDSRAFPWLSRSVKIKPAECGDNAGLLGAAQLAFVSHVFES